MFEKFKEALIKKIEENSIKSELTYKSRDGTEHTETVYMKRGRGIFGDWHRAYLPIKDESRKWHVPNALFGGTKNLIKLLIYMAIVALFFLAYRELSEQYTFLRNLPCVKVCVEGLKNIGG